MDAETKRKLEEAKEFVRDILNDPAFKGCQCGYSEAMKQIASPDELIKFAAMLSFDLSIWPKVDRRLDILAHVVQALREAPIPEDLEFPDVIG